ncbi:zinc-dependent alcohol dehydrogenase family protein [Paenibacillus nasutitermitis]|uniref:NADPH:quinone oxidoreductase n=1 Tax=Paenibacillus nasutitermitis TaxID=1652958 RepID=A0A917DZX5_9BACL|nr:NAD(P)-dependent alcohol dehydrogenase [Paenibacillus nasutitermitis]GGD85550.1 NADPH:quinone oxidoreductase [Paenibacillus nasutitermitis]
MKSYHINMGMGLAGLTIKEHDIPVPGPGEVLVRVRACSLNFREIMIIFQGFYPLPVLPDVIPVSDGAGEVVQIGEGTTRVKPGDRVAASIFPNWTHGPFSLENAAQIGGSINGMLTEYVVLSEDALVHIPDHLSFEEAATLPCAGVTAWNALHCGRPTEAGNTILTLGSGGVSLFALQFAKRLGARVIATTSSEEKAQRLKDLGADDVINYNEVPDWHMAVRELTDGRGVDRVVEVGGAGTLEKSIMSTDFEGQISLIGGLADAVSTVDFNSLVSNVYSLWSIAVGNRVHFDAMNRFIADNQLRPVIDRIFHFDEAESALKYLKEQPRFGKIVIRLD